MSEKDKKDYWKLKADPERYAAYLARKRRERANRPSNPTYETDRKRKWRIANPDKARRIRQAGHAVENALISGKLIRPDACTRCNKLGEVEGHHHLGYEREHWLDVVWLCQLCHSLAHYPR